MAIEVQSQFIAESKGVLHGVRRALAEILGSVGADPTQPQEISRRFGIDKTLSWKIARVVSDADIGAVIRHIPGKTGVRIFLEAMERSGAKPERSDQVRRAIADLDRLIDTHSGDRDALEAMVGATSTRGSDKRMEAFRKSGFQANRAIWGVQARLQIGLNILAPSSVPGMLDIATVCGLVGLRRLRSNVPWAVASAVAWDTPTGTSAETGQTPEPLREEGLINGVPVLPEFCSNPLPGLRAVRVPGGNSRFEITDGPIGKTAAATVMLGWKWPTVASMYWEQSPEEIGEHGVHFSTPVEMGIIDLFVHRSLTFAMKPEARVYSMLPRGPQYPAEGRDIGLLPMPQDVTDLGEDPPDTTTPEVPNYHELVEFSTERMGYALREFHGFRYRLRYPAIPTLGLLQHPLLPPIGWNNGTRS